MGILYVSPRASTQHQHKSTSPVAMDFAFRQGKPRWEYFVYLRGVQRSTSTKARHPWRWILRSGKANPDGNTLCISESFNAVPAQKTRHPWLWILRSGKANPDGNTLCISKGFNDAWAEKTRHGSRLRMLRSPIANVEMLCRRAEVEGGRTPATPRTMSPVLKEMMKR